MKAFLSVLFVLGIAALDPKMFGESTFPVILCLILFGMIYFKKIKLFNFNDSIIFLCSLLTVSSILHLFFVIIKVFGTMESFILIIFDFWFAFIMCNYILDKKVKMNNPIVDK